MSISDASKNWRSVPESKSPLSEDIEGDSCNCALGGDDICEMNKGCLQGEDSNNDRHEYNQALIALH